MYFYEKRQEAKKKEVKKKKPKIKYLKDLKFSKKDVEEKLNNSKS